MRIRRDNPGERLSAFLDGQLPAGEAAELERRLAADPALRQELEDLAEVKRLVGSLPRLPAPGCIRQAIVERLERRTLLVEPPGRPTAAGWRWTRILRVSAAAAVLLLAGALAVTFWQYTHPSGTVPPRPADRTMVAEGGARDDRKDADGGPAFALPLPAPPAAPGPGAAQPPGSPMADLASGETARRSGLPEEDNAARAGGMADKLRGDVLAKGEPSEPGRAGRQELKDESRLPARSEQEAQTAVLDEPLASQFRRGFLRAEDVKNHRFEQEPVVLDWPVNGPAEQKEVAEEVRQFLLSNSVAPVDQLEGEVKLTADDHSFYYQGRPSRNYDPADDGRDVQILVRARTPVVAPLIAKAQIASQGQAVLQERLVPTGRSAAQSQALAESGERYKVAGDLAGRESPADTPIRPGRPAPRQAGAAPSPPLAPAAPAPRPEPPAMTARPSVAEPAEEAPIGQKAAGADAAGTSPPKVLRVAVAAEAPGGPLPGKGLDKEWFAPAAATQPSQAAPGYDSRGGGQGAIAEQLDRSQHKPDVVAAPSRWDEPATAVQAVVRQALGPLPAARRAADDWVSLVINIHVPSAERGRSGQTQTELLRQIEHRATESAPTTGPTK